MTDKKIRIVYISNLRNTFTKIDEDLLNDRYDVHSLYIPNRNPKFLLQTWEIVRKADIIIAWFASWHSLPAFMMGALLNKPRIVITGGYDVANVPEINYGLRQGGLPYVVSEIVFRLTNIAVPFSETAYRETINNTPLPTQKIRTIKLGVPDAINNRPAKTKEALVITIAGIDRVSVKRKGIMEFVQAASYLPGVKFIVVGKHQDATIEQLRDIATSNVEFTGFLPDDKLAGLLQRASVYVQASYHEGFGLAVAQAMLARCIPVVSRRGSLPEVVHDTGFYIDTIDPENIANSIQEALKAESDLGNRARQHILENFSMEQRRRGLYNVIDKLVHNEDS